MPLVNVVDIVVALLFGSAVFGEMPGHTVGQLGLQLFALGCVSVGLVLIASLRTPAETVEPAPVLVGEPS